MEEFRTIRQELECLGFDFDNPNSKVILARACNMEELKGNEFKEHMEAHQYSTWFLDNYTIYAEDDKAIYIVVADTDFGNTLQKIPKNYDVMRDLVKGSIDYTRTHRW